MRSRVLAPTTLKTLLIFFVILLLLVSFRDRSDWSSLNAKTSHDDFTPPTRQVGQSGEEALQHSRSRGRGRGSSILKDDDTPDETLEIAGKLKSNSYKELEELEPDHWPPWKDYKDKDYDPNRWHLFPLEKRIFSSSINGFGDESSRISIPIGAEVASGTPCVGPRGVLIGQDIDNEMYGHEFDPKTFPAPIFGSYESMGLRNSICFDRISRLQAYGLGDTLDPARVLENTQPRKAHTWSEVRWGQLQQKCLQDNSMRFGSKPNPGINESGFLQGDDMARGVQPESGKTSRTAVLLRTWENYQYEWNDVHSIRSLITELGLGGRGEYQVFILLHVKDLDIKFREDEEVARKTIAKNIPPEFRDITVLFNENDLKSLYPDVGSNDVYQHQFQPVQHFAIHHPEFDYIWNWEMDARYIGHHHDFLSKITAFARAQPRRYLWERSTRYFMPALQKTWGAFSKWVEKVVPISVAVWGPRPSIHAPLKPILPPGPVIDQDNQNWGVGEEADFITFLPLFDPQDTQWAPKDRTFNFPQHLTTPRMAFINTLTRLSTRLLHAMHLENKAGRGMVTEMWPSSVALHYGLKVVYAPHPIFSTRKWDPKYANSIFNAGSEVAPGSGPDSVYAVDREHNFGSMSWYYDGGAAGAIYRRWLGWPVKGSEGKELTGHVKERWTNVTTRLEEPLERLCLPGMLLHPVKNVNFEHRADWNGKEM